MNKLNLSCLFKLVVVITVTGMVSACKQGSVSAPKELSENITNITNDATLTVNHENPGGSNSNEGSSKLIDGDKYSKFLVFDYSSDFWAKQKFNKAPKVNAYTVTAGNDAPERDPKNWKLEGSNDGSSWKTIDTKTDVTFDVRNQTKIYHLDSEVSYKYYRFAVTANYGSDLMQISEWRLLYYES